MSSIDEIKARIDILDLAAEAGVKLRRSGRNYTGFCPFHQNVHTPAFVVWPESGTWRCFGACNEGGDIFKFVMKKENVDFREALQRLADRAGVKLESFTPEKAEQREENAHLRALLEEALTFYRQQLLNTSGGRTAHEYLVQKRGLSVETIETFGLGYAPPGYDHALKHFTARGVPEQDLIDAGLLSVRAEEGGTPSPEKRRTFDRFRNRLMIPIRDAEGRMAGFGARILDPNDQPKFLNSPETPIFSKGRLLYGLDRARKPIRAADQAVIVEGYLDVIALHQAGFENVISPMGTALTEDQMRLLKRFTRRIVLALDPDVAGQKAVLRGLEAARASLDRNEEIRFDVRGLLRHESRLQADLRVAAMPDGLDPDEIVQRDRQQWPELIRAAKPIVEHVLETLISERDINDHRVKGEITAQMLPLIEDLPDPVVRDSYRQMLARRLRVDERTLIGVQAPRVKVARRPRQSQEPPPDAAAKPAPIAASPTRRVEANSLAILLRHPELLPRLDRALQESGLAALSVEDFGYTDHQVFLRLARQALEQDASEIPQFVQANLPEGLQPLYVELAAWQGSAPADKLLGELIRQVLQLRRQVLTESINQLRFLLEEGGESMSSYQELVLQQVRALNHLDQARKKLGEYRKD